MLRSPESPLTGLITALAFIVATLFVGFRWAADIGQLVKMGTTNLGMWNSLAAALVVYGSSHVFRLLRFALLLGHMRARELIFLYLLTTGASYAIPFKLGEVFRIFWVGRATNSLGRGIVVVWIERILDATIIAMLYLLALLMHAGDSGIAMPGAIIVIPLLVMLSVLVLKVLPENIGNLNLWILRSYRGSQATRRLRWLSLIRRFTAQASEALKNRALSLIVLSLCIWSLEIFALHLALASHGKASLTIFVNKMASIIQPGAEYSPLALEPFSLAQGVLIGSLALVGLVFASVSLNRDRRNYKSRK